MVMMMMDMNHGRGRCRSNRRSISSRVSVFGFIPPPVGRRLLAFHIFEFFNSSLRCIRSKTLAIFSLIEGLFIGMQQTFTRLTSKGLLHLIFTKLAEQGKRVRCR